METENIVLSEWQVGVPGSTVNHATLRHDIKPIIDVSATVSDQFPETLGIAPDHSARKHHKAGPSKLGYLQKCPGFTSTDGTSEAAEQGTRLHEIMDSILQKHMADRSLPLMQLLDEHHTASPFAEDERPLLVTCIRELEKWLPQAEVIENEIRVYIYNPDGSVLTHGSLDVGLIFQAGSTALVIDYKFGWIPVPPAAGNLQGRAYALGMLMRNHGINKIGVKFIQPKLGLISDAVYTRAQINEMYQSIRLVIDRAQLVQKDGVQNRTEMLAVGDHCAYCQHAMNGTCPAKVKQLMAVTKAVSVPMPSFNLDFLDTPEKLAAARYAVEMLEGGEYLDGIKKKALEVAEANGGRISCTLADGTVIVYEITRRRFDRSVGNTLDVKAALDDLITMDELLGCADLSLGKLENCVASALYEKTNSPADKAIDSAKAELDKQVAVKAITKKAAQEKLKEIKALHPRITKEEAKEQFAGLLAAHGCLSRPDGTIPVLKRQKNETKLIPADKK